MNSFPSVPDARARLPGWVGVGVLALFTLAAVLGYWTFALHPNLIPDSDFARQIYGLSFQWFARVHIALSGVVLAVYLFMRVGMRWVPAFLAVAFAAFMSEHIGTGYGFPFSGYEYTSLLGFKVGGRVPALIPISWFLMALPSWILANAIFRGPGRWAPRILLAAYLLTAWDVALDPAMSYLTPYWVWENPGPFYGMPWVNLAGWMGTGLVLMGIMEILGIPAWSERLETRWMAAYYAVVLLMPIGMLAAAEIWGAVAASGAALLLPWAAISALHRLRKPIPRAVMKERVSG